MDVGNGDISKRKISLTIQLSAPWEYEGGELQFMISKDIITFSKEKGSVICFPSFYMHRVLPLKKGNRKALVLFISGPPFR
jgi:PKHD-type hydroxylase